MCGVVLKYVTFNASLFLEQGGHQRIRSVSNLVNSLPTAMHTLSVDKVNDLNLSHRALMRQRVRAGFYSLVFAGTVATKVAQSRIRPKRLSKKSDLKYAACTALGKLCASA